MAMHAPAGMQAHARMYALSLAENLGEGSASEGLLACKANACDHERQDG